MFFFSGCSNSNKEHVKKIRVFEIGVVTKPIHQIIFSLDSVTEPSNLWYFNVVLSDSIFDKVNEESLILSSDTAANEFLGKPPYHGFELYFYSEKNQKVDKRVITDSMMFTYLDKINDIMLENHIDTNTINKIKYVQHWIHK